MRTGSGQGAAPSGYADRTITKAPPWHGLVAWDMLFNGLTTGLFLMAAAGEFLFPDVFAPLARLAYPIALVFLLVDLACLVFDLGDPWRFHHMLRVVKLGSPMSVGTWCLTIYSAPLTVVAVISLLDWPFFSGVREHFPWGALATLEAIRRIAVFCGLLPALGSAVYKGVLISTSSQPGWKAARWLGGYLTSAAPLLGSAFLLGLATLTRQERAAAMLRTSLVPLLVLNLAALALLAGNVWPALRKRYTTGQRVRLISIAIVGGIFAPLILLRVAHGAVCELVAVLLILTGQLCVRFAVVMLPQEGHSD